MKSGLSVSSDFRPLQKVVGSSQYSSQYYSTKVPVFVTRPLPAGEPGAENDGDDGDPDLPRPDFFVEAWFVEKTDLSLVGLQVWVASLALCDYLVSLPPFEDGTVFLELGCGVGLPSLVLSKAMSCRSLCRTAFMTDVEGPVLDNARRAAELLCRDNPRRRRREAPVDLRVRALDWGSALSRTSFRKWEPELLACGWTPADVAVLEAAVKAGRLVVLAADPVYDESLTEGLVGVLYELSEAAPKLEILLSLERRVNFLVGDVEPRAVHYDHFWNELRGRCATLVWERLPLLDPPAHVFYQKNPSIELWRIYKKREQ